MYIYSPQRTPNVDRNVKAHLEVGQYPIVGQSVAKDIMACTPTINDQHGKLLFIRLVMRQEADEPLLHITRHCIEAAGAYSYSPLRPNLNLLPSRRSSFEVLKNMDRCLQVYHLWILEETLGMLEESVTLIATKRHQKFARGVSSER